MKRMAQLAGTFAWMGVMGLALCGTANAQNGGGGGGNAGGGGGGNTGGSGGGNAGGGGLARHGGNFNIVWDTPQAINGKIPRAAGSVNVSTYVTTLNVDLRIISLNLPDDTQLTVTVYANDYYNGLPWPTKVAGTVSVLGQKVTLLSTTLWTSAPGFLPVITNVVVTEPDGTVVMSGRP